MSDQQDERKNESSYERGRRPIKDLQACLEEHRRWLDHGAKGAAPLVFKDGDLRRAQLVGAKLRQADLSQADLSEAVLKMADLTDANLTRADLTDAVLSKARIKGANLCGATLKHVDLKGVEGLTQSQLAGTDLTGAELPEGMEVFPAATQTEHISRQAQNVFLTLVATCVFSWVTMTMTTDAALLGDGTTAKLPLVEMLVPQTFFFWAMPIILLCLHLYFLFYLQALWNALGTLPATFTDGGTLDLRSYPWLMIFTLKSRIGLLSTQRTLFNWLEHIGGDLVALGLVPLTLFCFCVRCLCLHDVMLSGFHATLFIIATVFAVYSRDLAVWTTIACEGSYKAPRKADLIGQMQYSWYLIKPWTLATVYLVCILLALACAPPTRDWTKSEVDSVYHPWLDRGLFARLDHADLSFRPPNWSDSNRKEEDKLQMVKGAFLQGINLRNASARKVFLVHATMTKALLDGACLHEADLRSADLNSATLSYADLQNAKMNDIRLQNAILTKANFKSARLRKAILSQAQARKANFYNADLSEAWLDDADLKGAILSTARLDSANLTHADLEGAKIHGTVLTKAILADAYLQGADLGESDLRGADLSEANLWLADLRGADLWRADLRADLWLADLRETDLRETDLRGADLRGADLRYANLRSAKLEGAKLDGADLTGADVRDTILANKMGFLSGSRTGAGH